MYLLVEPDGTVGAAHSHKKDAEIMALDYAMVYGCNVVVMDATEYEKSFPHLTSGDGEGTK